MDNETTPKVINLSDFLPKADSPARTVEAEYKGVRFVLRHITRNQIYNIGQTCSTLAFDKTTKTRSSKLDVQKLHRALASAIIVGWSGLTYRTIQSLVLLDGVEKLTPEQLDSEIVFSEETAWLLVSNVSGLDEFIQEISMDPDNFRSAPIAELAKN